MEHRSVEFNESAIRAALRDFQLGGLRVLARTASTNDDALTWAREGGPHLALVVADAQTKGRGRGGRQWMTPAGCAIAMSVVVRSPGLGNEAGRLAGLGALAVCEACAGLGLDAQIKWPNDVLLAGRKTAGVLVETQWDGSELDTAVVGIGINVGQRSVPPSGAVAFPATCLEAELDRAIDRVGVLRGTVAGLLKWYPRLTTDGFREAWQGRLAFRNSQVRLARGSTEILQGALVGLAHDGSLMISSDGRIETVQMGELHLLRANDRIS